MPPTRIHNVFVSGNHVYRYDNRFVLVMVCGDNEDLNGQDLSCKQLIENVILGLRIDYVNELIVLAGSFGSKAGRLPKRGWVLTKVRLFHYWCSSYIH